MSSSSRKGDSLLRNRPFLLLLALFIILISYVAYNEYNRALFNNMMDAARAGYDQGVIDTVSLIYQEAEDCQLVPLTLDNTTRHLVDVSCLEIVP